MRLRWWRLDAELRLDMIPRPSVKYVNEGPDWRFISIGIGTPWSDGVIGVDILLGKDMRA
jgi:hypothetical protein